jgi:hypothetical protein
MQLKIKQFELHRIAFQFGLGRWIEKHFEGWKVQTECSLKVSNSKSENLDIKCRDFQEFLSICSVDSEYNISFFSCNLSICAFHFLYDMKHGDEFGSLAFNDKFVGRFKMNISFNQFKDEYSIIMSSQETPYKCYTPMVKCSKDTTIEKLSQNYDSSSEYHFKQELMQQWSEAIKDIFVIRLREYIFESI